MKISQILCLIIAFVTSYACAMEERLRLSNIEKQLIAKEVKERGKEKILAEIRTETKECTPIVYDEISGMCSFRYCMSFKIDKKFYQKDASNDPLTKQVFDIIQRSENKKDQRPDASWNAKSNVLGKRIQYWWIKDADENSLSGIQVKFRPHYYSGDQKAVEEVVQSVVDEIKEEKC